MKYVTTIIIGAGQAGLAMSKQLSERSVDHVILERGEVANSWKTERWNSLRLLTPNWQSRLPGFKYDGADPDGFMDMTQVISFLDRYAEFTRAPVQEATTVLSVEYRFNRYVVKTTRGTWASSTLVLANGACNIANVPKFASEVPSRVRQITPMEYKSPDQLDTGRVLIVGGSATGVQLAKEIQESGREVTLSLGEHIRLPRTYRGRDIKWWMDVMGMLDMPYSEVEDLTRARRLSSLQLVGSTDQAMLDANLLQQTGVNIVGRLAAINNSKALFAGSLVNMCKLADLKMNRLLDSIDEWIGNNETDGPIEPATRYNSTEVSSRPQLNLDLMDTKFKTIIWSTGYRPDYSWLNMQIFDRKGNIQHDGGIVDAPGLYVLGLPFLRKRNSTLIDGVGSDAAVLADHLKDRLNKAAA